MKKIIPILLFLLLISSGVTYKLYVDKTNININKKETIKIENLGKFVLTKDKVPLFEKNNSKYIQVGTIEKNNYLELDEDNKEHLKIKNSNLYISFKDLVTTSKLEHNLRYKDYITWNESIVTKAEFKLYDEDDNLIYTIKKKKTFPIIIKEENKYGIEFNDNLYFIKEYEKIIESNNSNSETRSDIRTLTYHTIYDKEKGEVCTNYQICLNKEQFEKQLKYIKDNNYLTLTMEELEMFLDKKIQIPKNSIVLTLDDGLMLENAVSLIERYEVFATFFIITSEGNYAKYLNSNYARFESHTHDMHNNYKCTTSYSKNSQGGQMICAPVSEIVKDLKTSQEKLNGSYYFAYPFFDHYGNAKEGLKQAGFKLAFIGQWNTDGYSTYDTDKYMIRRKTVFESHDMEKYKEFLQ